MHILSLGCFVLLYAIQDSVLKVKMLCLEIGSGGAFTNVAHGVRGVRRIFSATLKHSVFKTHSPRPDSP